jgi:hypothetical protein
MLDSSQPFPGRLRLRFSQLKRQPLYAAQVAASIRGLNGVLSVDANAVTGGLLIVYDVALADRSGLWPSLQAILNAQGLYQAAQQRSPQPGRSSRSGWTDTVADKVVGTVVEKLLERSAFALVAALL